MLHLHYKNETRRCIIFHYHARMGTALSAYVLSCRPSMSSSVETGRMLSGQSTNETTWVPGGVWYDHCDCDTELKLVL